ncbi:hypothetical protein [Elongatibacter sediminis]|uniref:NIPSNAP domain-containing protein n=1 Tax=Elongatibacter sediminis TaxID=3119006 RepID=A0AAW9RAT0_9GAMM
MNKFIVSVVVTLIAFAALSSPAQASEGQPVIQVQRIDVHGNPALYVEMVERVIARQNQVAPELKTRVLRADFAGEEAGLVYVLVEFPNLEAMAEALVALEQDEEWRSLVQNVVEKTGRKIISRMLLTDISPWETNP